MVWAHSWLYRSCAAEVTQSCHIRWCHRGLTKYTGMTYYTLWLEENRKTRECKAVWQQLEMTVHVSDCILPDWTDHWGVLSTYSSNYRYCCTEQMSTLGVTSKRDYSKCSWHTVAAASCCESLPKHPRHLTHACCLGRAWGGWEGKGKERSAAIIQLQYLWKNSLSDALKLQRAATLGLGRLLSLTALQCWAYRFIRHSCSR